MINFTLTYLYAPIATCSPVDFPLPAGPTITVVGDPSTFLTVSASACIVMAQHPKIKSMAG